MKLVVIGAGEVGAWLANALSARGAEVVVVDRDQAALVQLEEQADVLTMLGDATYRDVLRRAGVATADATLVVTGSDDANVVAGALAAAEGADRVVVRVDDPSFYDTEAGVELGVLGIHAALCVSRLLSEELLRMVRAVDARYVGLFAGNSLEVALVQPGDDSPWLGRAASELPLQGQVWATGVARDLALRPCSDIRALEADDAVLLAGTPLAVDGAMRALRGDRSRPRVVVVGGGDVGFELARTLLRTGRTVDVLEVDLQRCTVLAEALPGATILHADGTHIESLRDEAVDRADFFIAVTPKDEVNLMASLLAVDLGVPRTFALVHRPGYTHVYTHLGIHGTAGPHEQIQRLVQWMLPASGAACRDPLPDCAHELIDVHIPRALPPDATVADLALPPDVLPVALSRAGRPQRPAPDQQLMPDDHLIIASPPSSTGEVWRRVRTLCRKRGAA